MNSRVWLGVALLKIASVYLVTSLVLGLTMAISKDHTLVSVHSHIGLLGWATMGITGLAYLAVPALAASRLALVHFWLHNLSLPVMLISLSVLASTGDERVEPVVAIGSVAVLVALVVFAVNALWNTRARQTSVPPSSLGA